MANGTITDEQWATLDDLVLQQQVSVRQAAKQVGISAGSAYKRYKDKDPKPGGNAARPTRAKVNRVADDVLTSFWEKASTLPSIPASIILHCDYCSIHFAKQGPVAARLLVEQSKDNPALRAVLEGIYANWERSAWGLFLVSYFGVPFAHHLAPPRVYKPLQRIGVLPAKGATHRHDGTPVWAPEETPAPERPTGFAAVDTETLLKLAEQEGMRFNGNGETATPVYTPEGGTSDYDTDDTDETNPRAVADAAIAAATAGTDTDE